MQTLMAISIAVIAFILVLTFIFSIPVLLQVRRTAREAEKLIDSVRVQAAPLSRDIGFISRDIRSIVQSVHRQVDKVEEGIVTVEEAAGRLREFEEAVLTIVGEPLLKLATLVSAVSRGIGAFLRFFRSPAAE